MEVLSCLLFVHNILFHITVCAVIAMQNACHGHADIYQPSCSRFIPLETLTRARPGIAVSLVQSVGQLRKLQN